MGGAGVGGGDFEYYDDQDEIINLDEVQAQHEAERLNYSYRNNRDNDVSPIDAVEQSAIAGQNFSMDMLSKIGEKFANYKEGNSKVGED
jgi:hypothetical protein